jgi:hypothetical protein
MADPLIPQLSSTCGDVQVIARFKEPLWVGFRLGLVQAVER